LGEVMRFLKSGALAAAILLSAAGLYGQKPAGGKEEPQARIVQGIPPRVSPAEYQAQGRAGQVTIAAELAGHGVPTPDATFTSEDYLVVEAGLFGAAGVRLTLSPEDFSLKVNGKKAALPAQPYGLVVKSLKNPDWEASEAVVAAKKSKTSVGDGSQGQGQNDPPPPPPKMPIEVRRAMELKVQKASLPEGDRALPVAGLLFFQYSGKVKGMKSVELVYSGPAGKVSIPLQP